MKTVKEQYEKCKEIQGIIEAGTGILVDQSEIYKACFLPTYEKGEDIELLGLVPVKQKWSKKWKK